MKAWDALKKSLKELGVDIAGALGDGDAMKASYKMLVREIFAFIGSVIYLTIMLIKLVGVIAALVSRLVSTGDEQNKAQKKNKYAFRGIFIPCRYGEVASQSIDVYGHDPRPDY